MSVDETPGYRLAIRGQYDALYGALAPEAARARHEALAPYVTRVLGALDLPDAGYHVDVGCGDGLAALAIARSRPQMQVVGVDAAPQALALARALAREDGLKNVHFVEGDAEAALDGQFERISALSVFDLVPDKREALAAWRRMAAPGVRLVLADGFATSGPGASGAGPVTSAGLAQLARETGWRIVRQEDLTPLVTKLAAARAWPWAEYLRPGVRYALVVLL